MPFWSSISFTNLTSLCSSYLESLHDLIMVWLVIIFFVVIMISYFSAMNSGKSTHLMPDSMVLESTWTVIPMLILVSIAFPSIHLLCMQDSLCFIPSTSIKITSNQWNWQSTMLDDSWDHLVDADKVENVGSYEVPLLLSSNSYSRMLLSSTDVLHSLGVPSLGIKLDSMPGRINSTVVEMTVKGLFSGSCYELCGSGHSVMPIYTLGI